MPSRRVLPIRMAVASATGAGPWLKPPISTSAISRAISTPTIAAIGKAFQKPTRNSSVLMSSIITTNRNSTMTAPT